MLKVGVLCLLLAVGLGYTEENNVLVLGDSDFPAVLEEFPNILIEFYAPWCGHCKKLAPIYDEVATQLKEEGVAVRLGKVDATENSEITSNYGVRGYPTLFFFKNGEEIKYEGDREKAFMLNWLRKKTSAAYTELSAENYAKLQTSEGEEVSVVFHGDVESAEAEEFKKLSDRDDYNVYYFGTDLGKPAGSVELLRSFADDVVFSSESSAGLAEFIQDNERPLILPFDGRAISAIFHKQSPAALLFVPEGSPEGMEAAFEEAAKAFVADSEHSFKLKFTVLKQDHEHFGQLTNHIKITPETHQLVLVDLAEKTKCVFSVTDVSNAPLKEFFVGCLDGSGKSYSLQEEVKEEDTTTEL